MSWIVRGAGVVGVVVILVAVAGIGTNALLDRRIIEEARSPSGDRTAVLHSLSEGDSVAYGTQLVVRPTWVPLKNLFGEPIFRGDCPGRNLLRWKSESELELLCENFSRVELKSDSYDGVRISY